MRHLFQNLFLSYRLIIIKVKVRGYRSKPWSNYHQKLHNDNDFGYFFVVHVNLVYKKKKKKKKKTSMIVGNYLTAVLNARFKGLCHPARD